jgi:hypothetical protein
VAKFPLTEGIEKFQSRAGLFKNSGGMFLALSHIKSTDLTEGFKAKIN